MNTQCYETHSGTHYPTLASVPWQSRGSAVLVDCDGTGPAHGDRRSQPQARPQTMTAEQLAAWQAEYEAGLA